MGAQMTMSDGMRNLFRVVFILMLAIGLSACARRGGSIPYAPADFGPPKNVVAEDLAYDLNLGPLDMVKVNIFRVPELSGEYQVDARGLLDLPLLGPINVREFTPQQLSDELEQRYSVRYLNNPEITIRVVSTNNNNVTVEGGVLAPGIYSIPGKTTLVGAVALARGVAPLDANPRRVVVFRKSDGKTLAAAFDLVAIRRGEMEDPVIYPGDTVVVDSSTVRPVYRDLLSTIPLLSLFLTL